MNNYSDYLKTLDKEHTNRYLNKIDIVNIDPYLIKLSECSDKVEDYPNILYPDIVNYLLYNKSAYTQQELKAYKGLEAYKQASCGWVRSVHTKKCIDKTVVLGRVLHSQHINESATNTWIIAEDNGCILCAHCDCIAGLGETCTHVCAILFFIDASLRKQKVTSVTDVKSLWTIPSKLGAPKRVAEIEFGLPKRCGNDNALYNRTNKNRNNENRLSTTEVQEFLSKLKLGQSVLHTVVSPFSIKIHDQLDLENSLSLNRIYKPEHEGNSLETLQKIGSKLDISISIEECCKIEAETNKQANSPVRYKYRAGRITASKFKSSCRTKLVKPSLSLIKSICYPLATRFKTTATVYGCEHEKTAFQTYIDKMEKIHINFGGEAVGLCLNPKYPQFGASPDGLVSCDCCGMGVVEIKCPYCAKDIGIDDLNILKCAGVQKRQDTFKLDQNHAYYYQIQMQLAVTGVNYCDFVVWSNKNFFNERILFNEEFWNRESAIAKKLFYHVIIPELLGKYYTNQDVKEVAKNDWSIIQSVTANNTDESTPNTSNTETSTHSDLGNIYCICKGPDNGTPMIACSNLHCSVEWRCPLCIQKLTS